MCGIIGIVSQQAAEKIHLGLAFLQHRGQDSAGIAVVSNQRVLIKNGFGIAEDVFSEDRITAKLPGDMGIGHVRYSTAGSASVLAESQPFYINQPYGMTLAHNGNLINCDTLRTWLADKAQRHINSDSDSEVLLNVLAYHLAELTRTHPCNPEVLFQAVTNTHQALSGSYSVVALITGIGLLAFRDPHGVRPLTLGKNAAGEYIVASENVAFRPLGFDKVSDIAPGEAVLIEPNHTLHRKQYTAPCQHRPCIFEYIYLARPDSTLDGVSVYKARLNMGRRLAETIQQAHADIKIDCIVPVPDSGRIAAMELASRLGCPYREALVKNRHTGRTFITAGQRKRRGSVRKKLNVIESEFKDKSVLLVDDSIVRGTTGRQLVELARAAGAKKVYFASAAPPVRHPNIYGIDIPTRAELLAGHRDENQIADHLGADRVIYQSLQNIIAAVRDENAALTTFETSCFDGDYRVGEVNDNYLAALEEKRRPERDNDLQQGDLPLHIGG